MKWIPALFLTLLCAVLPAAETVLPAGSGVFNTPEAEAPMIGALPREWKTGDAPMVYGFLEKDHLVRRIRFYETTALVPERKLYVTPDVVLAGGLKQFKTTRDWRIYAAGIFHAALLAGAAAAFWRCRKPYFALTAIVALRGFITGAILFRAGDIFLLSSDEADFFVMTRDMMNLSVDSVWPRTFGQGLFYLPFALLRNAADCFGILADVSYFNAFLVTPAIIVLLFLTARKLTGSERIALAASLLYAVVPMFYFHVENWAQNYAMGYFAFPPADWCYAYYQSLTWSGFNAMSDTPSTALVLLLLYGSLALETKYRNAAWLGALFGLACLFRINNIFYAPAAAYLWLERGKFNWRKSAADALAGAAGFLAVFGWQFYLNHTQFGSVFTFPYVLYDQTADGFRFDMLSRNLPILFGANIWLFLPGFIAIALLRSRKLQIALLLWIVPTLIFFAGYVHTRDDVTRFVFPVYCALAIAVAAYLGQFSKKPAAFP